MIRLGAKLKVDLEGQLRTPELNISGLTINFESEFETTELCEQNSSGLCEKGTDFSYL